MASTPARQIIADGGKVSGVYAEGPDGVIQVNAKAVILATGGYANSTDILTQCGCNPDKVAVFGMPGHDGDGMPMGLAAGAKSWLSNSSLMEYPMNPALDKDSSTISNNDWPVLSLMSNAVLFSLDGRKRRHGRRKNAMGDEFACARGGAALPAPSGCATWAFSPSALFTNSAAPGICLGAAELGGTSGLRPVRQRCGQKSRNRPPTYPTPGTPA